ncbi:Beta-ketoacyl synthase domain protein [Mycobacterium simiae]
MTSINDQSTYSPSALPQRFRCSANTGAESSNWAPMPSHCEPWPGKTNTVLPTPRARPVTTLGPGSPAARPASPAASWPRLPTTTARCSKVERVDTSEKPTSSTSRPGSACSRVSNRCAWPASASGDRADNTHGTGRESLFAVLSRVFDDDGTAGACSKITCAFVPLIPNDDTPARRGRSRGGHGWWLVNSDTAPADQSTCGVGTSTCSVLGMMPWRIACTILMTPATPAAAEV